MLKDMLEMIGQRNTLQCERKRTKLEIHSTSRPHWWPGRMTPQAKRAPPGKTVPLVTRPQCNCEELTFAQTGWRFAGGVRVPKVNTLRVSVMVIALPKKISVSISPIRNECCQVSQLTNRGATEGTGEVRRAHPTPDRWRRAPTEWSNPCLAIPSGRASVAAEQGGKGDHEGQEGKRAVSTLRYIYR